MATTAYAHIDLRPDDVAIIAGTRTKIVLVVMDWNESGYDIERLTGVYPHLTHGQLFSALAYYYDHKDTFDREVERRRTRAESLRDTLEDPELVAGLVHNGQAWAHRSPRPDCP